MRFLLGLLVFSQIGLACATDKTLKVSDLSRQVETAQNSIERLNVGVHFDFAMKKALMDKLAEIGARRDHAAYKSIYRLFDRIRASQKVLEQSIAVVEFYIGNFAMAAEGKEKVTSRDHSFYTLVQVREDLPGWVEKVNARMAEYLELAGRFDREVNDAQIGQIDVRRLREQVDGATEEIRRQTILARKNIKIVRVRIGSRELNRRPEIQERLQQLESILERISRISRQAEKQARQFERHADRNVFLIAPHMASHRRLLEIQKSMSRIQDLVLQYNSVIQEAWNSRRQARK